MARAIYVPQAGGFISFKDNASDADIVSYLQTKYPSTTPEATPPAAATQQYSSAGLGSLFGAGLAESFTDVPGGISSLATSEDTLLTKASEEAKRRIREQAGIKENEDWTIPQYAAYLAGQTAGFFIPVAGQAGLIGKVASGAGKLGKVARSVLMAEEAASGAEKLSLAGRAVAAAPAVVQGGASQAMQAREKIISQREQGMEITPEQQLLTQRLNFLIGTGQAIPVERLAGPIASLMSKVPARYAPVAERILSSRLGRLATAAGSEGAQEALEGIASDLVEAKVYNPDVEIGQDIFSNAVGGGFAGSLIEGVLQIAAGRKVRPIKQLQADLLNESRQNTEKVRLGQIAQAAENLRQTGVEGTVDVEQSEFDGLPVFNIKAPGGDVIARFDDQDGRAEDNAIAAVNLYAKNTGVKVEPNIVKKEPEAVAETDVPEEAVTEDPEKVIIPTPKISPTPIETPPATIEMPRAVEAIPEEMPIGAVELPIEEQRYIEPEAVTPTTAQAAPEAGRIEMRPSATVEQLTDLKAELFGKPLNVREMTPEQLSTYEAERDKRFPPAPETVYYSAGQAPGTSTTVQPIEATIPEREAGLTAADVTPKSLREAYAMGPRVKAPTEEVSQKFKKIYNDLVSRVSAIAPADVTVGLREFIDTAGPGVLVRGQHNKESSGGQTKNIIDLATGIYDPGMTTDELLRNLLDVLNHEVIHALRANGLIRPAEWRILSRAVAEANMPGKKYTYLDKAQAVYTEAMSPDYANPDAVIEEAVAELYKDWVRNGKLPKGAQQTQGLLNRITEFFRRIFRTLRDNKYEEVFQAIERGEVRGREGVGRESGTRLSASNMPPESNAQKTQISGTFPTYKKAFEILNKERPDGKQLDFGAGLGMSQQLGFDTFEPYPRSSFTPTYNDSGNIQSNSYEKIVNLNVLNVVPIETRSKIVKEIGRILSPGGVAIITTRGRDVMNAKGMPGPEPMSVITSANTYQKGFTSPELIEYVSRELGDGFVVERLNLGPAGVIIRKSDDSTGEVRGREPSVPATVVEPVVEPALEPVVEPVLEPVSGAAAEEGLAATSPRFSAAPLPTYIQSQNQNLFTEPPKLSFAETAFNYLFGFTPRDKEHMRTAIRANIVDTAAAVTLLEKKINLQRTGNFERRSADYSATAAFTQRRRASHLVASSIMMGPPEINFATPGDILSATVKIRDSQDNLLKVFETMMQPGPVDPVTGKAKDLREVFKTYAIAIRGRDFRAKGKAVPREITPQYVNEALSFIPREYPQVVEAYNMYQRLNKELLTAARDAGLISTAELGRLTQDMNYYGFYREVFQEELAPTSTTKTAGEFKLREYKGSQEGNLINDPMFVIIRNTQFWMESIAKNLASVKSYDVAQRMGEAQLLGQGQSPDLSQGFQKDIMYFKKDGVLKRFAVKDPLLVTALGSDDRVNLGKAIDILGMPASILRESVTRDPAFMVANLLRDTVSSWITSGENIIPFIGTAKGVVSSLKQSASFKDLMGRGVVGSYDMAMMEPAQIASTIRRRAMPKNIHTVVSAEGAIGAIQSLWDRLGAISEASDAATRIAVYDAARAQGLSEAEAAMRAVEIMDFSRRGASHLLNIMTKMVPFLNARIQGLDVLYQAAAAGKRFVMGQSLGERDSNLGKKFLVRGLMLAAISVALEMINSDDDDYKQLDSYIKDSNLLIPLKWFGMPGQFIAVSKPFESGLLFSTLPQHFYKMFAGQASTRETANLFFSQFASTFGVNPLPQILIPPLEIITNHDFYTGLPLISEGKLRLDPSLQYDSRTSSIAMMISNIPFIYDVNTGEFRGPSPIAVDNLISGYTGPLGSYISMALGAAMSGFDAGPERMPMEISQAPVIRRFFVDAKAKNPAVVTQAYELFRIVDEANRTFSRLRQSNDAEALLDYYEKNKDVLAYKKYIMKLTDRLNKISAYERQIERDKTMTDEEKIEAARRVRDLRIRVASKVDEINKVLGR